MIGSYSNAPVASSVDGASTQAPPLIVPGRDGSIMLASSGLQQLPYRAQDLVASAPWSLGQRGTSMMVGSKTSFMVEVDLRTGHVLQTLPTITDGCPTSPVPPSDGSAPPSMWLGRNDYVVRAYDTSARKLLWNLTYSEVMPPALPSDAQDAEQRADNAANAYLEQCEARQGRNIFSATVHGEITASDAITGALKWRSESLGAPLAHVYDVCSADSGETSYIEHRLLEVWPASAEFQQQLLNGGGASIAGGGGGDDGGSKAQRSEVFVGALPGGQLYVLPRSPYTTFDFTSPPEAFVSGGGGGGALLPAPVYDAATLAAAAKDVVVVHADDGVVSDSLITAHWLEQCGALWDLTRDPQVEYQCLIGVHNVTAAVDSHALRALPAAAALISGIAISSAAGSEGSRRTEPFAAASILSLMARQIASSIAPVGLVPHIAALLELVIAVMTVVAALLLVFSIVARVPCCRRAAQRAVSAVLGNWKRGGRTNRSRGRGGRASANDASGSTGVQPTLTIGVAAASDASVATATDAVAGSSSNAVVSAPRSMHSEATVQLGGVVHRVIGRLAISDRILGYGCNGTVVYAGQVDSRPVAIKRMLRTFHPTATREISLLIRTDGHANVVRYFACEEAADFVYLALELCDGTLADEVARAAKARAKFAARSAAGKLKGPSQLRGGGLGAGGPGSVFRLAEDLDISGGADSGHASEGDDTAVAQSAVAAAAVALPVPTPTPDTRRFLREIASAIAHLHSHHIAHRDVKPANILISSLRDQSGSPTQHLYPGREFHSIGTRFAPKISDFGLGKQLSVDASSYGHSLGGPALQRAAHGAQEPLASGAASPPRPGDTATSTSAGAAPGSIGWMAPEVLVPLLRERSPHDPLLPHSPPADRGGGSGGGAGIGHGSEVLLVSGAAPDAKKEQLAAGDTAGGSGDQLRWRRTRAADVWALGCVFFHVLDPGAHPFGQSYERERNILRGAADLSCLEPAAPEMHDLIAAMLRVDPTTRPSAHEVAEHPAMWSDDQRLAFLVDVSDRLERECEGSALLAFLEAQSRRVVGASWAQRLPAALITDNSKYRKYDYGSIVDCLRLLRNKRSHFRELPDAVRVGVLGSLDDPVALVPFFLARERFPLLLLACWEATRSFLAHEPVFAAHIGSHTAAPIAVKARARAALTASATLPPPGSATPAGVAAASAAPAPAAVVVSSQTASPGPSHPSLPRPQAAPSAGGGAAGTAGALAARSAAATLQQRPAALASVPRAPPVVLSSAATAIVPSREWYQPESAWHDAHAAMVHLVATSTGGPVVCATRDRDADGGSAEATTAARVMVVSAHSWLTETRFSGGAHTTGPKYKSMLCKDWEGSKGTVCGRGVRCDFAHGALELRLRPGGTRITDSITSSTLDDSGSSEDVVEAMQRFVLRY